MGFVAARRGEREEMQDAHMILPDMTTSVTNLPSQVSRLAYFAVFDGHGGARASQFAAENLHHTLASKFPKGERSTASSHFSSENESFTHNAS